MTAVTGQWGMVVGCVLGAILDLQMITHGKNGLKTIHQPHRKRNLPSGHRHDQSVNVEVIVLADQLKTTTLLEMIIPWDPVLAQVRTITQVH